MLFPSPTLKLTFQPNINLDGCAIKFVSDVKYLGVCLNQYVKDDADINRQVRYLYCTANTVRFQFHRYSEPIKNVFRTYCMPMYSAHLWSNYSKSSCNKIRVAYNNAFRLLHGIRRYVSARLCQIYANIPTFDAYTRNCLCGFYRRIGLSENLIIIAIANFYVLFCSKIFSHFKTTLYCDVS